MSEAVNVIMTWQMSLFQKVLKEFLECPFCNLITFEIVQ